jgi:hypothetical protein
MRTLVVLRGDNPRVRRENGGADMRRSAFVAVAVCVLVIGLSGSAAFAGEVTGTGKPTAGPEHANSICVFSGQNDDPDAPLSLDFAVAPDGPGGIAQSYGQNVKLGLDPHVFNPGDACRGGSNPDNPPDQ